MISFRVLLTVTAAAGAGYVAARQLMAESSAQRIDQLPEGAQAPLIAARARLLRGRARADEAIRAARAESAIAEQELLADFHRRTGRT